ncbi:MAG: HprK-related kinase A [Paraglaciecola sp.]|jgi:HprK-related kinase A
MTTLSKSSIKIPIGPFNFQILVDTPSAYQDLTTLYQHYPRLADDSFIDFSVAVKPVSGLRKFYRPQAQFSLDDRQPFKPLPVSQAYPMLEWGMNWCIANYAHQYLMLHSAIIEKNGQAIILPAPQGSGKSTLCAAMTFNGWRLFSDEIALIDMHDGLGYPCTRPINLKNQSISILQNYAKQAVFSSVAHDTHKGSVSLLKPQLDSVEKMHIPAPISHFVFPKYKANSKAQLFPLNKLDAFSLLIGNSFNYHALGKAGFEIMAQTMTNAKCYMFEYSQFDEANSVLTNLVED